MTGPSGPPLVSSLLLLAQPRVVGSRSRPEWEGSKGGRPGTPSGRYTSVTVCKSLLFLWMHHPRAVSLWFITLSTVHGCRP